MSEQLPETIGHFRIVAKLGQGGMGTVYRAVQGTLEREVALKILPHELSGNHEYLQRFMREARTVAQILHENVVTVFEAGQIGQHHYIAMQLVDGTDLQAFLDARGRISEKEGLQLLLQAAKGLSVAHARGLVHRDVKPQNLLMGKDGVLRVVDFGLVMESTSTTQLTATGACLGTPMYMSPEQADGEQADARTDVYSLGVTFYRVFTGQAPFVSNSVMNLLFKHKFEPPLDPRTVCSELSENTSRLLLHMMSKRREDRPADATQVVGMIEQVLAGKPLPPPPAFIPTVPGTGVSVSSASVTGGMHTVTGGASSVSAIGPNDATMVMPGKTPPGAQNSGGPAATGSGAGKVLLIAGAAAVLLIGGGAFAAYKLFARPSGGFTEVAQASKFAELMKAARSQENGGDLRGALDTLELARKVDAGNEAQRESERVAALLKEAEAKTAAAKQPQPAVPPLQAEPPRNTAGTPPQGTTGTATEGVPAKGAPTVTAPQPDPQKLELDRLTSLASNAEQAGLHEEAANHYAKAAALADDAMRAVLTEKSRECQRQLYLQQAVDAEKQNNLAIAEALLRRAHDIKPDPLVQQKLDALQRRRSAQQAKGTESPGYDPKAVAQALAKVDEFVRANDDAAAMKEMLAAARQFSQHREVIAAKEGFDALQAVAAVYDELLRIIDAGKNRAAEAAEIDDEDRLTMSQLRDALTASEGRFAERRARVRPQFLARDYPSVKMALTTVRQDAAALAAELNGGADHCTRRADKESEEKTIKGPLGFKITTGGNKKKAERYRAVAEGLRRLVEQASAQSK